MIVCHSLSAWDDFEIPADCQQPAKTATKLSFSYLIMCSTLQPRCAPSMPPAAAVRGGITHNTAFQAGR